LVEALRRGCVAERDRLAEGRFESLVKEGVIAFSLVADTLDYELPTVVEEEVAPGTRPLFRPDGEPIRKSLLQPVFETSVGNRLETEFACYLDAQSALKWWHRNVARTQYGLQGWRRDKVYPDFVFAKLEADASQTLVVMETKGLQLKNTEDTVYKQKLLARLSEMYRSGGLQRAGELALVSAQGTRVVCDLVFGEEWRGALGSRYFS
jgi:type III restriction enzyme